MATLVTGATGFIGGHLIEELVRRGEAVKALVRERSNTSKLLALGVELVLGCISSRNNRDSSLRSE